MQIQISWLLQKPTDLDLHCLLRQGMSCLAREGLIITNVCKLFIYSVKFGQLNSHLFGKELPTLSSVHFVAALLYLSVFPFGVGGMMWI